MIMDSAVWPADSGYVARPLVTAGYLICACTMSAFLAKRITTISALRSLSVARILVLAVLLDSFLFVFTSAILVIGIGTSLNEVACAVGIWWCIMLYATSKIFIYLFLMERVYLVYCHTAAGRVPRWKSPWYRASCAFFLCWIIVAILMIVGRIAYIRQNDRACVIGLKIFSTVPMLTVDAVVNLFLTASFVIPIYRSRFGKAQTLARNSIIAALMALATSFVNIVILAVQDGKQLSWVCLGSCGIDVFLNACIIFYITAGDRREVASDPTPSGTISADERRRTSARPSSYFPGGSVSYPAPASNAFPNLNRNTGGNEPQRSRGGSLPMQITQTVTVEAEIDLHLPQGHDEDYYSEKGVLGNEHAMSFHAV